MRKCQFLSESLVESDPEAQSKAKPIRRRAAVAALASEVVILSGLVLWPLLCPASLSPESFLVSPLPNRVNFTVPVSSSSAAASPMQPVLRPVIYSPPRIPPGIFASHVAAAQNSGPPAMQNLGNGLPVGLSSNQSGFGGGGTAILPPKPVSPPVRIIRRSEHVEEDQLIDRVLPIYPAIARVARISGTVELLVLVGRDGRVESVQVLSGNPLLANSAKQAVEGWRYRPAFLNGQPVEVETQVTVHFVLDE